MSEPSVHFPPLLWEKGAVSLPKANCRGRRGRVRCHRTARSRSGTCSGTRHGRQDQPAGPDTTVPRPTPHPPTPKAAPRLQCCKLHYGDV